MRQERIYKVDRVPPNLYKHAGSYNRCPPITGFTTLEAGDPMAPELGGADRLALGIMLTMTLLANGAGWVAMLVFG